MSNGAVQQKLGVVTHPYTQEICFRQQIWQKLGSVVPWTFLRKWNKCLTKDDFVNYILMFGKGRGSAAGLWERPHFIAVMPSYGRVINSCSAPHIILSLSYNRSYLYWNCYKTLTLFFSFSVLTKMSTLRHFEQFNYLKGISKNIDHCKKHRKDWRRKIFHCLHC